MLILIFITTEPSPCILRQHRVLRNLRKNKDTVITKPDKGNGVVILDQKLYNKGFSVMTAWRVDALSSHSIPDILKQFVYYLYSLNFEIYIESNIHLIKGNQIHSSY